MKSKKQLIRKLERVNNFIEKVWKIYECWLIDEYPDEIRCKEDLIKAVEKLHRIDEFFKEIKEKMGVDIDGQFVVQWEKLYGKKLKAFIRKHKAKRCSLVDNKVIVDIDLSESVRDDLYDEVYEYRGRVLEVEV